MRIFFCLLLLSSCSNIKPINNTVTEEIKESTKVHSSSAADKSMPSELGSQNLNLPIIDEVKKVTLQNGKVAFVDFLFRSTDGVYSLNCSDKKVRKILVTDNLARVYLGANYFRPNTNVSCFYNQKKVIDIAISKFPYKQEKLNVPKGKVVYSKKALARIIREKEIKGLIYKDSADHFYFNKSFIVPLKSYITSVYGNQRLFNNLKKSQHLGNDLRAAVGVKIPVSNRGKVVYTGNLFFSGNVVVVDHGMNIFTMYAHLSKILISKGSIVNQGDIIGLAGATGRVSGPHLHWGVRINGSWVDGFNLVSASRKHFNETK